MKYFSLAIAFFVCAAVVSAAPSPASPLIDIPFGPFDKLTEKLNEYYQKFLCARDVVEKNVDKTVFQKDFEEFKYNIEFVMNDWKQCGKLDLQCKFATLINGRDLFGVLFQKIYYRNKEFAAELRQKVEECFEHAVLFEESSVAELDVENAESFGIFDKLTTLLKQYYQKFLCARNVVEKSVDKTVFQKDFEEFKYNFDLVLSDWKQCETLDFQCKFVTLKKGGDLFGELFQKIHYRNKQFAKELREKVTSECFAHAVLFEESSVAELDVETAESFGIFDKLTEKLQEYYQKFLCARDVIEKNVDKTVLQKDFEEFKATVNFLLSDWKTCDKFEDKKQFYQCKFAVLKEVPEAFGVFFQNINERNKVLAKEIREKVNSECFAHADLFEDTFAPTVAEQFQCMVDTFGQVSKENGLEELWSRSQPQLQLHLDNLKTCGSAGNKFWVFLCNVKNGVKFYKTLIEFMQLAAQKNPQVLQLFIRGVQQKCAGQTYSEIELLLEDVSELEPEMPQKPKAGVVEKFKCMSEAITEAVKDTDFASVWDKVKEDMEKVGDKIKACKNESSKLEVAKCIFKEVKEANAKVAKFLRNLAETNVELFNRAREYVKERCL